MSANRTDGLRSGARIAGIGAATAVVLGLLSTGAANADTFVPLPDGQRVGPAATITRNGEHALISPSMAANGAGRVVWVSGNAIADVTETPEGKSGPGNGPLGEPGTNNSSTSGVSQVNTGYIVGCQVSISDTAISLGGSANADLESAGVSATIGIDLAPGQIKWVQIDSKDITKPGVYSIEYQDTEIGIQGCAGYAQARAYTVVEIIGLHHYKTTLYGMPFSIG
ncbi:mspA family protein [Nocardia panacis]|uniref:MspA family protein n=1 Tax=Nocardia panacis TaxID=2340916 RepID=A0A3A4KS80_9NOCA|nr:MspA family porin [Nocardia panacis]RJO76396.1 mspA family protein [Nocardia panacis]